MIAQADSRKWMACLYNSFLFMEAKIMKMAKKLLALVLTGVMAMSVLTGCGSTASRQAAGELEGMLKKANPNATVADGGEALAIKAIEVATTDDGKFEINAKSNIKTALKEGNDDKYVWYACFEAEGKNKTDKAQAIADEILKTESNGSVKIGDTKAVNYLKVVKSYNLGDEFVLSMKEFTVTNDDKTTTDWIMAVVTCKGVENK